jgi:hypothetical protein
MGRRLEFPHRRQRRRGLAVTWNRDGSFASTSDAAEKNAAPLTASRGVNSMRADHLDGETYRVSRRKIALLLILSTAPAMAPPSGRSRPDVTAGLDVREKRTDGDHPDR